MTDIDDRISELRREYNGEFVCNEGSNLGTFVKETSTGYTDSPVAKEEAVNVNGYRIFAVDTDSWAPKIRVNPRCPYLNSEDHGCSSNSLECTNVKIESGQEGYFHTCTQAKVFDV